MSKKRIALFGAHSRHKPFAPSTQMADLLKQYGNDEYALVYYEDVVFELETGKSSVYIVDGDKKLLLESFDTVYLRNIEDEMLRAAIAQYCRYRNVCVLNSENLSLPLTSKLAQYVTASFNNVPIPKTFFSLNDAHKGYASTFFKPTSSSNFVIKSITGSNGRDNIKTKDLYASFNVPSVIQEFISNAYEYRVIVVDNEVALSYKKVNMGTAYQNNIAKGGKREPVDNLPQEVAVMAKTMARLTKREIAGADIVCSENGRYVFFEINYSYGNPATIGDDILAEYAKKLAKFLNDDKGAQA